MLAALRLCMHPARTARIHCLPAWKLLEAVRIQQHGRDSMVECPAGRCQLALPLTICQTYVGHMSDSDIPMLCFHFLQIHSQMMTGRLVCHGRVDTLAQARCHTSSVLRTTMGCWLVSHTTTMPQVSAKGCVGPKVTWQWLVNTPWMQQKSF